MFYVLGSGTMPITRERLPSGYLVVSPKGKKLMLDCGHGTYLRLVQMGFMPSDLNGIFVSHFHTDHSGDFLPIIHGEFVEDIYTGFKNQRPKNDPLILYGPTSLEKGYNDLRAVSWRESAEQPVIRFQTGIVEHQISDLSIETFDITHAVGYLSVGIRITVAGKTIVYPGDVGSAHPMDDLVEQALHADLLVIEASAKRPTRNHLTVEQVAELSDRAGVKNVLITHLKPGQTDDQEFMAYVKGRPTFRLAEDRMTIDLENLE